MPGRAAAPLELVADFVNTLELPSDERIGTAEDLGTWLGSHGLSPEGVIGAAEVARAIELREALRGILLANNGGPHRESDTTTLNRVAAESGLRPRFVTRGGVVLEPAAAGLSGALGRLLAAVFVAMNAGTWGRLKVCADQTCQWAFYDGSKNWSRHWCSMESCGNRAKARQFRQRRRAGERPATSA